MSKIRGYCILVQFIITVTITIVLMYLFRRHNYAIRNTWMRMQVKLLGIHIDQQGVIDPDASMVLMNHQSLLDIIVVEYLHCKNLAWVAKKEITNMFFFGHIIKAPKMISIDREDRSGMNTLMMEAQDRLSKGRPIAIFPEGTRSSGKRLLKFKIGAKRVANTYKLKVQPIVLVNTRNILDSKTLRSTPGTVKVICLESVQADEKTDWFEQVEDKMRLILNDELRQK